MLTEINSDKFKEKTIYFTEGLNVVLGDDKATNSIGKSTLLMILDFVFGGNDLLRHNADIVSELGDHEYNFTFQFNKKKYYFKRTTYTPDVIYECDHNYIEIKPITSTAYKDFLKKKYHLSSSYLSFRGYVGLYSRIWGKDNLNIKKPLHYVPSQKAIDVIDNLLKVYDKYQNIKDLHKKLKGKSEENSILNKAENKSILPKILKTKYIENEKIITDVENELEDIKINLAKYAVNINEIINKEMLEQKVAKDKLLATKLILQSKLRRVQSNLNESKYLKSKNLIDLEEFFPCVNTEKVLEIEHFHSKISKILRKELLAKQEDLLSNLNQVNRELEMITTEILSLSRNIKNPNAIIDRVFKISSVLKSARQENEYYDRHKKLRENIKELKIRINKEREISTAFVGDVINREIRDIIDKVYSDTRKTPMLSFSSTNYTYEIVKDTGTGKAYSNLLVLDLAIFTTSVIPFLIHDSLLFKNIENKAVANLISIYDSIQGKQSFIAIDEIKKYGGKAERILLKNSVITLGKDSVLYIKEWRS